MSTDHTFKPPWWLSNRHLQSCYGSLFRFKTHVPLRWEALQLPDGDFLDICWAGPEGQPLVVMLHGLEGSVHSHYIQAMLDVLVHENLQCLVMNYRTCSGRINLKPYGYHGGDTTDLAFLLQVLHDRHPNLPMVVVGFSLGGNILMRYLAHEVDAPLRGAVCVSAPYELGKSADQLPAFYQRTLLRSMKEKILQKIAAGHVFPVDANTVQAIQDLRTFDACITAPLYGFVSADQYYEMASCRPVLSRIAHPTLILHALDDPFVPRETVPLYSELSLQTEMEITEKGGHVGFISGGAPWRPQYWFLNRIPLFLKNHLK